MLISAIAVLGSCSSDKALKPKDYLNFQNDDLIGDYSKPTLVTELRGMNMRTYGSKVMYFDNTSATEGQIKEVAINAQTGAVIMTVIKEAADAKTTATIIPVGASSYDTVGFITKRITDNTNEEKTVYTTELYTYLGAKVASATSKTGFESVESIVGSYYLFDEKIYVYEDGVATFHMDRGFSSIPALDYVSDNYFYEVNDGDIFVYDKQLKLVYSYSEPANVYDRRVNPLSNGNVLIQQQITLPDDAAEYDVFEDGHKYDVRSFVINPANGSSKELTLDFVVGDVMNKVCYPDYFVDNITISNIAGIYKIENKTFSEKYELVSLSDNVEIKGYLDKLIPSQESLPTPLTEDRYLVYDESGKRYLIDDKLNVIGEITEGSTEYYSHYCISKDGKYYDLDLNLICDTEALGYELVEDGIYFIIYKKADAQGNDKYYLFDGAAMNAVDIPDGADVTAKYNSFYYDYTDAENRSFRVFMSESGEEMLKFLTSDNTYVSSNLYEYNILLIKYVHMENGKQVTDYYISAKA